MDISYTVDTVVETRTTNATNEQVTFRPVVQNSGPNGTPGISPYPTFSINVVGSDVGQFNPGDNVTLSLNKTPASSSTTSVSGTNTTA